MILVLVIDLSLIPLRSAYSGISGKRISPQISFFTTTKNGIKPLANKSFLDYAIVLFRFFQNLNLILQVVFNPQLVKRPLVTSRSCHVFPVNQFRSLIPREDTETAQESADYLGTNGGN